MPSRDMVDNWRNTGSHTNNSWRYEQKPSEPINIPDPDPIPLYDLKPEIYPDFSRFGGINDDYDDYGPLNHRY